MIKAKKYVLGRKPSKILYPIKTIKNSVFNIGYGVNQLRPDKSRDLKAEDRVLSQIIMKVNYLSGQLI